MQKNQNTDEQFMRLAIAKTKLGIQKGQTPFGAAIVKKGKLVVCVHNMVWATTDITSHAEIHAIRKACKKLKTIDLSGCTLYSTCEPCPMCFSACHWARIDKIICGATIKDAKACGFHELALSNDQMKKWGKSSIQIQKNLLAKECRALFLLWAKEAKSKKY
ncbi:MAG TPA: nucleoside deaminase [Deltaproteobacteria bacterium]|nr:MAG: tRNA-specific adenosine deaminase [Deltaproteobacteria bacterium GWA2_45_12]HBF14008.1 nucleoside deaminase [Deltaproteobacteria bacterium]